MDWPRVIPAAPSASITSLSDLSPQTLDDLQRYVVQNLSLADTQGKISSSRIVGGVPGTELAYVEFTSSVTVTGTEPSPNDVVSSGSVNFDGTAVWIEFVCPRITTPGGSGSTVTVSLWGDGVDLGRITVAQSAAAGSVSAPGHGMRKLTPSPGPHTYKARAWASGGTGTVVASTGGAGVPTPGFLRITKA